MSNKSNVLPIKATKKVRESYPRIRNNYKKYNKVKWKWITIFNEIEILRSSDTKEYIKIISCKYNIPYGTLRRKYGKWKNDNNIEYFNNENDNRGGHNKKFTEKEEKDLYEYIKNVYIDTNLFLDDECVKNIASEKWKALYPENMDEFKASNGWVYDFKHRWHLSTLTAKCSRKSEYINDVELADYLKICKEIKVQRAYIFNMDETFWRFINGNINVIGLTGSDNRKVVMNVNNKSGFTAIFIISAEGSFLKPLIIIKGKTKRCLNKVSKDYDDLVYKKFSESGWINVELMKFILGEIHTITNGNDACLIMDEYAVHTDIITKNEAERLNIKLIYVPAGKTATHQPLDVSINGPIKAIGKSIIKKLYVEDPFIVPTLNDSIKALIEAKEKITQETIKKSFTLACNLQ